jgi:hypothetical protein
MRLFAASAAVLVLSSGCVKEISSEERLDRESPSVRRAAVDTEALAQLSCDDAPEKLSQARQESHPEAERLTMYIELFKSLRGRTATFEEAMMREPDLSYREEYRSLVSKRDACVQHTADVQVELEQFTRDLVQVPTVQEIKGGNAVVVPRLDFDTLRHAIETLSPEDKEQLLGRVASAERRIESARKK